MRSLRLIIIYLGFLLLARNDAKSQVANYVFSETNTTYVAITGGTQLVTTTSGAISYDTDGSNISLAISSQFVFNNVTITSVNMTADGSLWLNPGTTTTGNGVTGPIASSATAAGVISAMGMDLRSTSLSSRVYERRWQDLGTELVFQWQNCSRYLQDLVERFSFQIRITKSTGVVRIVYGDMITIANDNTYIPQVGLRGNASTDYNTRRLTGSFPDATPNWGAPNGTGAASSNVHNVRFTANGSCFPVSGLVFIWTPPLCSALPSGLTSSGFTTSSATINWTAASPAPGSGYQYYLSTTNTAPVSTTTSTGSVAAGVTTVNITGLSATTTYYVWVRSNCNGTDLSPWAGPISFTTPCATLTVPWSENFDAMASIGNSVVPSCWKVESTSGTPWASMNAASITYNDPASAPNYMTVYYSPYTATEKYLITPGFNLTAGVSYDFSFQYAGDGYSGWNADAGYNTVQTGSGYTILGTSFLSSTTTTSASYTNVKRSFIPSTTGLYYFIVHVNNNVSPYYLGFDNFSLTVTPACSQQPSALLSSAVTATSATISWTAASPAPASGYQYYLSTTNTAPVSTITPTGSVAAGVTTVNLTGLSATTTYYVWVRSNCNGTDLSPWAGPVSFTTPCAALTVPWSENFDAMASIGNSVVPSCWKVESTSGTPWASMNAASITYNDPASAPNYMTVYYSPYTTTEKYLITPGFNLTAGVSYDFSFQYAGDGYSGWNADAGYNTSPTGSGYSILGTAFLSSTTTTTNTYTTVTRRFIPSNSGIYYFMVHVNSSVTPYYLGFDNFTLTTPAPCAAIPPGGTATASPVTGAISSTFTLNASGLTNLSGLTYQWQSSADGLSWSNIAGATTNPYVATAVNTITTTYYRLVVTCTASGLSANSNTVTYVTNYCIPVFTTGCTSLDYIDNFTINTLSNLSSGCNGNAGNYINYTPAGSLTTSLTQGVTYNASITIGRGGSGNVAIWIDYNNNGLFETTERYVNTVLVPSSGVVSIPVAIPVAATLGARRMRVMEVYNSSTVIALDPCTSYTYGETEDYTITIIANAPCAGTPAPGNTVASQTSICAGSTVSLSLQNQVTGSGITYQWQSSSDNITYANIAGATSSTYVPVVNASTWFMCIVTCSGSNGTSVPIQVTVSPCIIMPSTGNTTATTCSANFYDSGGLLGNYNNNENGVLTIYPATPGSFVRVTFNSFEVEACCDNLKIYNGNSATAPIVGTFTSLPGVITSTAADGSLTFVFRSDFSVVATGWEAVISCYTPPPCSGTPAPGSTLATNTFLCTNTSTVLSIANPPAGSLVSYQWQIAPDVAGVPGSFSNIAGATSPTYNYTPVAAATNWYRCIVTCSGSSANSDPVQIVVQACNIINMSNGSSSTCSARFYDSGGAGGNDNTSGSAGNYGDNQSFTYTIYPSTPGAKVRVSFNSFNIETCCDNLKIYDGNSAASLLLGVYTANPGTITSSAADGSLTFVFTSDGSVNRSGWDATVSCFIPPPCTSILTGGTAASSPSTGAAGSTFTLNATGYSAVSGLTFQWQTSSDGVTWTNMPGATTIPYTVTAPGVAGVVSTTYYQLLITCPNTNTTVISEPTTFITASYCIPTHTTSSSAYITKVSFLGTLNDVTNNSTYSSSGYQDFTSLTGRALQAQGEGVNLYIQTTTTAYMNGWADWNNDGTFDAAEKIFTSGNILAYSSTYGFVIPLATPPGNYRIRIRTNTISNTHDACVNLSNGETEDYLLTVIPTCNIYINGVTNGTVCGSGQVTLNVSATAGATTYYWYTLPTGGVPAAITNTPTWTTPAIRSNTYYYVTAGDGNCESIVRTVVKAYALSVPVLNFTPVSPAVCGEGAVLRLNATGNNEEAILLNENFENGLGQFTVNTITSTTSAALTQWQVMTSTYLPTNTAVWHPAISSGVGSNHFVYATSDFSGTSLNTALVSPTLNSSNFLNLYMDFSIYYSHYLVDGNTSIPDSILIEASTNNGASWTRVDYYISDQGIGTRFADNTVDLSAFINQTNLKVRIRYFASWCDGVAVDDIKIYGNKPLTTLFGWTPFNQNNLFTDSAGLSPYTGGSVQNIFVRPTPAQLDAGVSLNFTATATLSNGCSATAPVTVAIIPSQWTGDISNDWSTAGNWCSRTVPTATTRVEIPPGITRFPVISNAAFAKSLKLNAGASLTLTSTGKLSLYGAAINSGGTFDAKNGTVEFAATTTQYIDSGLFSGNNIRNLIVSNDSVVLRGGLNLLNKLSFTGNNRKFITNNNLTLKSSDTLTAYLADITNGGTVSGNLVSGKVTTERYISSRRAWRLLSMPTMHDLQTIKQAWQEGAATPNANPVSRFGTQITSNRATWLADGFDTFSIAGPSMKIYNPVTNLYDGITSTQVPFQNGKAYMTFIRGDRSVTQLTQSPTSTILREKGSLFTGNLTLPVGTADSQFVSLPNPYASAIDFTKLTRSNVSSSFYLWDPALSTYGAYQTCIVSGNSISYTPGGGSYSSGIFNIQSGQGFFVRTQGGAGAINYTETSKVDGSSLVSRNSNIASSLRTQLYKISGGTVQLCDGVLVLMDDAYSAEIDSADAIKVGNANENLCIFCQGKKVAIESRPAFTEDDTLFYQFTQPRMSDYRFAIISEQIAGSQFQPFLIDKFLQTETQVSLTDTTHYVFTISSDAGSYAPDRFLLVFRQMQVLPVRITTVNAYRKADKSVEVGWQVDNEWGTRLYETERSDDGRTFRRIGQTPPSNNQGGMRFISILIMTSRYLRFFTGSNRLTIMGLPHTAMWLLCPPSINRSVSVCSQIL